MKKWLIGLMSLVWACSFISLSPAPVRAIDVWGTGTIDAYTNDQNGVGFSETDPRTVVARIVKIALGFLGTIAVVLIIVAGFQWMTAAGNEEKIGKAKKLMSAAVIGLVIVLMAFALSSFIINAVITAVS
ncbi:MAG TPA: hypothetical protein P5194_01210 [Patescibacteria group bacterium]|nr:hypothetical protein [Patescibacteria group bacterium]